MEVELYSDVDAGKGGSDRDGNSISIYHLVDQQLGKGRNQSYSAKFSSETNQESMVSYHDLQEHVITEINGSERGKISKMYFVDS